MSDTPETDDEADVASNFVLDYQCQGKHDDIPKPIVVPVEFARKLERERDEWRQHGHREADMRLQLMGERDDARLKVERERDEIRAQLREALKFVATDKIANAADMRWRAARALASTDAKVLSKETTL